MHKQNLFYLVCISLLSTTVHALSKKEVLKLEGGRYYCKDDICVSTRNRIHLDSVIIPNKEGKNITYITDTCSITDINIGLCNSTRCNSDSQCFSNKCYESFCTQDEKNPPEECQYVRTVHNNPIFGDPKGYKTHCGLPSGYKCNSDKDCSSYNCQKYNQIKICEYPDDSGCHSLCNLEGALIFGFGTFLLGFIEFCICLCLCFSLCNKYIGNYIRRKKGKEEKSRFKTKPLTISAIVFLVILLLFWGVVYLLRIMGV